MVIPVMMRPPPRLDRRPGARMVTRLCTRKASTSSRQRRLDTRGYNDIRGHDYQDYHLDTMLGEISLRDNVRLVNATRPHADSPERSSCHVMVLPRGYNITD